MIAPPLREEEGEERGEERGEESKEGRVNSFILGGNCWGTGVTSSYVI